MTQTTRNVVFIRRLSTLNRILGAAYLRGPQLIELVRPHFDPAYEFNILPYHATLLPGPAKHAFAQLVPRDSIVIFIKSAARGLTRAHLDPLWKRGAVIGFDSVDTPIREIDFSLFDFHIAASISGQKAIQDQARSIGMNKVPVELLLHHADLRIRIGGVPTHDRFKCGYAGQPENLCIPVDLRDEVQTFAVKFPTDFERALKDIRSWSFHYAVRPSEQVSNSPLRAFKPFTKGAIAAACAANILVHRETDDAVDLLGDDYPYFVDGSGESGIRDILRMAKSDFGGQRWLEGIERMREFDASISGEALAARMKGIFDRVASLRGGLRE